MLVAKYLNMTDDATTVDFLIEDLKRKTKLATIIFQFVANKPKDIKEVSHKFKELYSFSQNFTPSKP